MLNWVLVGCLVGWCTLDGAWDDKLVGELVVGGLVG